MSNDFPLIGIPCRADTIGRYPGRPVNVQNRAYIQAVVQAGGLPVLIPLDVNGDMLQFLFDKIDGLLLSGGGDVDPKHYHETPLAGKLTDVQRERDDHELALARMAINQHKPFFAICRGIQVMNVAAGGSLWQDLASQQATTMRHDYYYHDRHFERDYLAHQVELVPTSLLSKLTKRGKIMVNSLHHQAVKQVAAGLCATGYAEDGVIEVLEVLDHPFGLGVQWHPEELVNGQEEARHMFTAFIDASRDGHQHIR